MSDNHERIDGRPGGLVICCEHAGNALPVDIGASPELVETHRGYDLGAGELSRRIHAGLGGRLVVSRLSRLFVDLNRAADEPGCIPAEMDGTPIPGNRLDIDARADRIARFYDPYHAAVDAALADALAAQPSVFLLSVHTYTPELNGVPREMETGVLFDDHEPLAHELLGHLGDQGFADPRPNEPYSGMAGLIYSASTHGKASGVPYLELEVRNDLLGPERIDGTAPRIVAALRALLASRIALMLMVLAGLVGCETTNRVQLDIYNRTHDDVKLKLLPYGPDPPNDPRAQEHQMQPRSHKQVWIERGEWHIRAEVDDWEKPYRLSEEMHLDDDGHLFVERRRMWYRATRDEHDY